MILHTGGVACDAIITRSKPRSYAISNALEELMIPSVSPSTPIRRTSFAVISSLSRFSLSFALIVQHLQAKKNTVQRHSLRTATLLTSFAQSYKKRENINPHHNRCAGESGALCFVLPEYYTTPFRVCQEFFENFSIFLFFPFGFSYDMICLS